jgi:hypothetical protein
MLMYGGVPVPWTSAWTAEETFHVARCRWAGMLAICQAVAQGEGKPRFGKPHSQRQRQAIAAGLCDLCAKPLRLKTKVSLSHARIRLDGAQGACVMQVEPLLCRPCAILSMAHCPSLKRDIKNGTLMVRQVGGYQVQIARMSRAYVKEITGTAVEAAGHAKVVLLSWKDRDAAWLEERAA